MPTSNLQSILDLFKSSQKKANKANEERYAQLLKSLETLSAQVGQAGTFGEASKLMENIGTAARTRIAEQTQKALGAGEQDLISRGLAGSTVRGSMRRGVRSDEARALQEQSESEAGMKAGLLTQRAGAELDIGRMRAGAIQGRTDLGPDLGMFSSLLQAAAQGEEAGKRTTVRTPASTAGGAVTRWRAEQAAGRGGGGAGGGGLSPSTGGGGGGGGSGAAYHPPGSYGGARLPYLSGAMPPSALTPPPGPQPGTVFLGEQGTVSGTGFQGLPPSELQAAPSGVISEGGQQPQPKPDAVGPAEAPATKQEGLASFYGHDEPKQKTGRLTPELKSKYKRWKGMGWGWMIPEWARDQI